MTCSSVKTVFSVILRGSATNQASSFPVFCC